MVSVFVELAGILVIALLVAMIVRAMRQPMIIAYILTGVIVGPMLFNIASSREVFEPFAKVGISLLLFISGLSINPKVVKHLGKVVFLTGIGQIIFTFFAGFVAALLFGFSSISALYIALALSFSSTIVVTNLLGDKDELDTLHGRIATGFILVQDLIHIVVIVGLLTFATLSSSHFVSTSLFWKILQALVIVLFLFLSAVYFLPSITRSMAKSQELLLLFSITWAIALGAVFEYLNFSVEIGALLAGITLSMSPYKYEINSRIKPFRDFFLLVFFIWLGTQIAEFNFLSHLPQLIVLSSIVLIGIPVVVMSIMGLLGYTKRNSFLASLAVAQISEFSFVLSSFGLDFGHISSDELALIVFVGIITIAVSSYAISFSDKLYRALAPYLSIFEQRGKKVDEQRRMTKDSYDVILFGYNRIGYSLRKAFVKLRKKFLVVDNNPEVIMKLSQEGVDCLYGDAEDVELLNELPLRKAKLVVSTIPDLETNHVLLSTLKERNSEAIFIGVAHQIDEALELYEQGADYVITPHFLGGEHVASLLQSYAFDREAFEQEKKKSLRDLHMRKREGHRGVIHHRD
ncbi:sodium:proton exchanger [Candidatus Pacearchaeota archaeon]|nr:MAG: sodium:proton exchanger [Candidatus Pacearchaeota archaeon]